MASVRKLKKDDTASPWIVEYTDSSTGKRVRKTPKTGLKKDADALRRKIEAEIDSGVHLPASVSMTIADLSDAYQIQCNRRKEDGLLGMSRHRIISYTVTKTIKPKLGHIKLCDLTEGDVEEWYNWLRTEKKNAPLTAKSRAVILRAIEEYATRRGQTKKTPVRNFLKSLSGLKKPKVRTFSAEEVARLMHTVAEMRWRRKERSHDYLECMVHLAACCGLRYGEIMGLTLENVRFTDRRLEIRHNLTSWDELKGPKTEAGNRNLPLPEHVSKLLGRWIERHYLPNERRLLFRTYTGGPILAPSFHRGSWIPLLRRAGLGEGERFHFHGLRHFASSWMIANGLPITDVAKLMGHSHFDTTLQIYAHPVIATHRHHDAFDRMATSLMLEGPITDSAQRDIAST